MPGLYFRPSPTSWLVVPETETGPDPVEGFDDLVPALLSNSSGGWTASASAEYYESGAGTASAFKAFNRIVSGNWIDAWNAGYGYPQWNQLEAPSPITIKAYSVQIRTGANTLYPGTWKLQGWNGTSWDDLHSVSGVTWLCGEIKTFIVPSPAAYSKHRLYVTAGGVQCEISEIHYYG